ncbi:hypothetical protein AN964_14195 [Heyndrickxia shackletonii]|uniref:Uncharacterized protein n=1 Tax=Heyndrickxia shackletonii TaxID=157838 RepID=A0A0Q3WZD8_9BACI|nr:HTH domain-containing protein [Heyndrickxia shackletonii]KQL54530.1 hypothetical protein AN964_14195 [Heyndrickxia shackletonii]NEZ02063.1 HTH domain-containing protein [Heyndrickxia shackletonii]
MKKAITIIASEETYKNLSTFNDIQELNEAVRYYKEQFKDKLSKSTVQVLDQLQRYSCVYFGVSFRAKANIAETLNISRRTVIRACQLLEKLGIIKQYEMKRSKDMQQTSNAIVIQPVTQASTVKCHTKTNTKSSLKQNINKRTEETMVQSVPSSQPSFLPDWTKKRFPELVKLASYFYGDPKVIAEFARISLIHSKKHDIEETVFNSLIIDSFKQFTVKVKSKSIKNIYAYYTAILKRKLKGSMIRGLFDDVMGF